MSTLNLQAATVTGFFSLPSLTLAETNPDAYNLAMAAAPAGSGTCAHCGNGIRNHVVVECDGRTFFIGTQCAERVGSEAVRSCVRSGKTQVQLEADRAEREKLNAEAKKEAEERTARLAARQEQLADILKFLRWSGTSFHVSLAEQLQIAPLSERQAFFVAKAMCGRRTKKNAGQFDTVCDRCVA